MVDEDVRGARTIESERGDPAGPGGAALSTFAGCHAGERPRAISGMGSKSSSPGLQRKARAGGAGLGPCWPKQAATSWARHGCGPLPGWGRGSSWFCDRWRAHASAAYVRSLRKGAPASARRRRAHPAAARVRTQLWRRGTSEPAPRLRHPIRAAHPPGCRWPGRRARRPGVA